MGLDSDQHDLELSDRPSSKLLRHRLDSAKRQVIPSDVDMSRYEITRGVVEYERRVLRQGSSSSP